MGHEHRYEGRKYDHLLGMDGFSDTLLRNHFTLYQGYVDHTNKLYDQLLGYAREGKSGPEFAELHRRFGWEWNGMRLHELYFENLGGKGQPLPAAGKLATALEQGYGSLDAWKRDFLAVGASRGIGWVICYHDAQTEMIINQWVGEHDVGHLAAAVPLLVMDVFEHAFITDYGLKRADYLQAFMRNVDWQVVEERMP